MERLRAPVGSLTYLLAIYRELISMQSLASNVAGYFRAGGVHSPPFVRIGGYLAMARWAEGITSQLREVLQAHFQYPILHYFRPSEHSRALPVQLGVLLELRRMAGSADSAQTRGLLEHHPSFLALQDAVAEYLRSVQDVFIRQRFEDEGAAANADPIERAHRRLLCSMAYPTDPAPAD